MGNLIQAILNWFKSLFKSNKDNETVVKTQEPEVQTGNTIEEPVIIENNTEKQNTVTMKEGLKILIDNGHGNDTKGKRCPYLTSGAKPEIEFYEYKWNREIAKGIVDELTKLGYDAELIVTEINDISLSERVRRVNNICNKVGKNNVIFISIHGNAAGNGTKWMTGRGWCAYTSKGQTKSDKFAEMLYDAAAKNFKGMKIRKETVDGDSDIEADFTVIAKTVCPAVLTENFFFDNVEDVTYMLSDEGRKAIIKTHVDAIGNWYDSLKSNR